MKPALIVVSALLAGCAANQANTPLFFGEMITFGVGIGSTAADQGADLTIGFKSRDVAIVPIAFSNGSANTAVGAEIDNPPAANSPGRKSKDAYSVLGQFNSETSASSRKVGLGKFFATGMAAQVLSQGFADDMRKTDAPVAPPAAPVK